MNDETIFLGVILIRAPMTSKNVEMTPLRLDLCMSLLAKDLKVLCLNDHGISPLIKDISLPLPPCPLLYNTLSAGS